MAAVLVHAVACETTDPPPRPDSRHERGGFRRVLDLSERWRVPYVLTVEEFLKPGGRLRLSRRWCRGVIATGPDLAAELIREIRLPARIVGMVPPGMPLPTPVGRAYRAGCVPVVGAASGPGLGSGLPIFLDAARQVLATGRDVEFVVAAETSGSTARLLGEGLGIADRITLAKHGDAGPSFWAVLDLYCHPARIPSTGRPLATAMAHGIPSITTDVPGLRSWIDDHQTGRIVPPGDTASLARAILELLDDPAGSAGLGRRGRSRIEREFSIGAEADALASCYRVAVASSEGLFPRIRADVSGSSVVASRFS